MKVYRQACLQLYIWFSSLLAAVVPAILALHIWGESAPVPTQLPVAHLSRSDTEACCKHHAPLTVDILQVMHELVDTVQQLDGDSSVRSIIITGKGKAFAAGADIKEMASLDQQQVRCD